MSRTNAPDFEQTITACVGALRSAQLRAAYGTSVDDSGDQAGTDGNGRVDPIGEGDTSRIVQGVDRRVEASNPGGHRHRSRYDRKSDGGITLWARSEFPRIGLAVGMILIFIAAFRIMSNV